MSSERIYKAVIALEDVGYTGDEEKAIADALDALDAIPKSELRELMEEWRETADYRGHYDGGAEFAQCADELEALLDE